MRTTARAAGGGSRKTGIRPLKSIDPIALPMLGTNEATTSDTATAVTKRTTYKATIKINDSAVALDRPPNRPTERRWLQTGADG
jgi:hypothetical protein